MRVVGKTSLTFQRGSLPQLQGERGPGFSLVELLVVLAIVSILAALLLPGLTRVKEKAGATQCLSNMRQIYVALQHYMNDYDNRYPTHSGNGWVSFRLGGGDPTPRMQQSEGLEWATNRILWPYTRSPQLFRCPADKGMNLLPSIQPFSSTYETIGCSYKYNDDLWHERTRAPMADPVAGLSGKKTEWVSEPSRYILLHEPPASPWNDGSGWFYFFWHYGRGQSTVFNWAQARDRFVSPVLFCDGHVKVHDFSSQIQSSPEFPAEPMPDWIWYKPLK